MSDTDVDWVLKFFCFHLFFWDFFFVVVEISVFFILVISWYYLTLTWTRFWHYLTLTLTRSWHCLTLTLSDTGIDWVLKFLSSENFLFSLFFRFHFFWDFIFFFDSFLIWKKIKETNKNLNKRIYCSLSKQWLIHQQLLSYCIGTSKIYKKFDFKAKTSDLEKRLFNSASGLFTQQYVILWVVCFFFIVKTVSLLK